MKVIVITRNIGPEYIIAVHKVIKANDPKIDYTPSYLNVLAEQSKSH